MRKNFLYYAEKAKSYEMPSQKPCETFKRLIQLEDIQKQFETAENLDEWCKKADELDEVYYLIYNNNSLFQTNKEPTLSLGFVGPGEGVPVIRLTVCTKRYQTYPHGF